MVIYLCISQVRSVKVVDLILMISFEPSRSISKTFLLICLQQTKHINLFQKYHGPSKFVQKIFGNIHGAVFLKSDITYHWVDPLWVYNTYIGRFLYLRVFYRQLTFDQRKSITLTLPPIGDFEQLHTWRGHSVFKYVLLMLEKLNFQRRCIIVK